MVPKTSAYLLHCHRSAARSSAVIGSKLKTGRHRGGINAARSKVTMSSDWSKSETSNSIVGVTTSHPPPLFLPIKRRWCHGTRSSPK